MRKAVLGLAMALLLVGCSSDETQENGTVTAPPGGKGGSDAAGSGGSGAASGKGGGGVALGGSSGQGGGAGSGAAGAVQGGSGQGGGAAAGQAGAAGVSGSSGQVGAGQAGVSGGSGQAGASGGSGQGGAGGAGGSGQAGASGGASGGPGQAGAGGTAGGGAVDCTGAGDPGSRQLDGQVYTGTGTQSLDLRYFRNIFEATEPGLPNNEFPGRNGISWVPFVQSGRFIALEFKADNAYQDAASFNWADTSVVTSGIVSVSISECPGDFRASLPPECLATQGFGSMVFGRHPTANYPGVCMIRPGRTYYFNVSHRDATGATTCTDPGGVCGNVFASYKL